MTCSREVPGKYCKRFMDRRDGNDKPLAGVGVVVTRPAHQAEELCTLLAGEGACVIRFPVLEIVAPDDIGVLNDIIDRLESFDIAIFISPNAVNRAVNCIQARRAIPRNLRLAAVGRGSARALARLGLRADIYPATRFNSEALLELEPMRQVAGKRIVIFRGEGGRELLAETLRQRGAEVEYAEVYRRVKPKSDVAALLRHWARGDVDVVTVTSNDGLRNLYDMVGQLGRQWLQQTPLVVVSERARRLAAELGFKHAPVVAPEASDEAIVRAVKEWRMAQVA